MGFENFGERLPIHALRRIHNGANAEKEEPLGGKVLLFGLKVSARGGDKVGLREADHSSTGLRKQKTSLLFAPKTLAPYQDTISIHAPPQRRRRRDESAAEPPRPVALRRRRH